METMKYSSQLFKDEHAVSPVLSQTDSNTTLWIGHLRNDPTDHFAGQTFKCPSAGQLDNIQVYTSSVQYPGHLILTMHEFDVLTKQWGPAIANSTVEIQRDDINQWIRFKLQPVPLYKDVTYAFRLQTADAFIAIAEAATGTKQPFNFGQEWNGNSKNEKGHFFTYFSLTFKVELRA